MSKLSIRKIIFTILTAAMITTGTAGIATAGEGGGGGDGGAGARESDPVVQKAVKAKDKKKKKKKNARRKAGPRKWFARDQNGKKTHKIERSKMTGRYSVSNMGRDYRSGRKAPKDTKTFSKSQWKRMAKYNSRTNTTTIRVKRGSRTETITVSGNAAVN